MAEQESNWFSDTVGEVGGFLGGVLKEGMAGYIEVEKAKASNPANQAASQNATFDSPTVDQNPTARANQSVAQTANGAALTGLAKLTENPATLYVAGGLALVGLALIWRRR